MAQVHLTLEDDILKDLMLGNREDAVSKLLEKVFDAVLKAQASEQLNAERMSTATIEAVIVMGTGRDQ